MNAGTIARRAGVNVETLRYYERRGLLPEPPRRESGYRIYRDADLRRLRFIKRAQGLGFTLHEIAELLALRATPDADRAEVLALTERKIEDIQQRIRDLERFRETLQHLAHACDGHGTTDECPILDALDHEDVASPLS